MSKLKTGYTLIEVLVGLAIIGLLFTVGYAGYRDFAKRQVLNNAYEELKINLNLARQLALSGEKPSACSGNFLGTEWNLGTNWTSYTIRGKCQSSSMSVKSVALPSGITISGTSPIRFNLLGQGTNLTSDTELTVSQTNGGSKKVTITQQGTIR